MRIPFAELLPAALQGLPGLRGSEAPQPPPQRVVGEKPEEVSSFAGLQEKLKYLGKAEREQVREAYKFADEAHLGQFRATGQPYITHPIAVAALCADWKLDVQAVMAALMHDTIEDRGVTKVQLIEKFGAPTADLVDGVTKLDKLQFSTREESQAESFRKMLLAMARDVRVILVKLADRLHNMRTMSAMAPEKARRIARETLDIYAPIAHRLGLNQVYRELQDLSFQYLNPWRHAVLTQALVRARGNRRDIVKRVEDATAKALGAQKIKVSLSGREKTVYSIYRKMREKHTSFANVSDLFGLRVVVPALTDCYVALGVLHQLYQPLPGRFKDYIALPKANGYQSLHTTLLNPLGTPVEFQIRTESMHLVAETGIAAHWHYKVSAGKAANKLDDPQVLGRMWLQSLLDIHDENRDSAEFLEHVKVDLHPDAVYVFTPKSKILALPRGATPIDFGYAIHSDVGDHVVAAKVNGEPVALRTELQSGDVVEVITAPGSRPNPSWLNMVRTARARSKIRHYLKNLEGDESRALGERMLAQALRTEGLGLPSTDPNDAVPAAIWQQLVRWSGKRDRGELMGDIGLGRKIAVIVAKRLAQIMAERGIKPDPLALSLARYGGDAGAHDDATAQATVFVDGSEGASVQLAPCCRPIPGDNIVGYLGRGEGLLVHTAECPAGKKLFERDSERWIRVEWSDDLTRPFETAIAVLVSDGKGVLARVAQAISSVEADITHIDMGPEKASENTELRLTISVRDRQHLADVIRTLRRTPVVLKVGRGASLRGASSLPLQGAAPGRGFAGGTANETRH